MATECNYLIIKFKTKIKLQYNTEELNIFILNVVFLFYLELKPKVKNKKNIL